ncbi:NK-lysin tandem duplicate 4 isoform X2 [Scomber scombrus]|uniref:NK-lysin tandem duplicate 4 isoform X2 n=1 Tax=Scomber scombrus TaxID=13677 RepID=UPI002DDABD75|nr:NK-lysin tandem duplicate 4 isoform X2 [Scomber scombrus]
MERSSVLLVCVLVACSVWTVHGRSFTVNIDDEDQVDVNVDVDVEVSAQLPGVCWACKWALNKVKKTAGNNATVEKFKSKLLSVCNQIGLLKSLCKKFVKQHLGELIEELTTTDDVRTICVNTKACKPKELLDLTPQQDDEDQKLEIDVYLPHPMHG